MLILIVFFAAIFGISPMFGDNARNSCLWAVVVNTIAACGGAAPVIYAVVFKPVVPVYYLLAAGTIRLLLAVIASIIILLFVKIDTVWFAASAGILYAAVLVLEVCFFTKTIAGCDEADKV
jgi:uncharacterized membrane-anchored protein